LTDFGHFLFQDFNIHFKNKLIDVIHFSPLRIKMSKRNLCSDYWAIAIF